MGLDHRQRAVHSLGAVVQLCEPRPQGFPSLAAHLAPDETRGRVVGNIMSGLLLGILLSRPISSVVAGHFGWRVVFGSAAVLMAIVTTVLALTIPRRHGRLKVRVVVDGETLASGTTVAR